VTGDFGNPLVPLLFVWGVIVHLSGFSHNELVDIEHDRKNPARQKSPLVAGDISLKHARKLVIGLIVGAVGVGWGISILTRFEAILWVFTGLVCGLLYNMTSKRNIFAIFGLMGWISSLCMFGAHVAGDPFNPLATGVTFYLAVQVMFQGSVLGALKDPVDNVNHFVVLEGKLRSYAWTLKVIQLSAIGLLFLMIRDSIIFLLVTSGFFVTVVILVRIFSTPERKNRMRLFSVHEILMFYLVCIMLIPIINFWVILPILIPIVWYGGFNKALFGDLMVPGV